MHCRLMAFFATFLERLAHALRELGYPRSVSFMSMTIEVFADLVQARKYTPFGTRSCPSERFVQSQIFRVSREGSSRQTPCFGRDEGLAGFDGMP